MTMGIEEENGLIAGTFLGVEDHNILTFNLSFDFGNSAQGFGGYAFDRHIQETNTRIGTAFGTTAIRRILDTLEVSRWEDIKGTYARIRRKEGLIESIGHIVKDQWFSCEELAREMKEEK